MLRCIIMLVLGFLSLSTAVNAAEKLWKVEGLAQPESVVFDKVKNRLIVTNINGHPTKDDGNGFLSLVSTDGKMIKRDWVTGLDAPKGIALVGRELIIADITRVHIVNADSGKLIKSIQIAGAKFLNDVATSNDSAWISDLMNHSIYNYKNGKVTLWLKDKRLNHPNGLLVDGKNLLVATWGEGMQSDFSTKVPGSLISVDLSTKAITALTNGKEIGNLDGVVRIGNKIIVNDWITGAVYELEDGKKATKILSLASGLADLSANGDTLYFPFMKNGTLEAYQYE